MRFLSTWFLNPYKYYGSNISTNRKGRWIKSDVTKNKRNYVSFDVLWDDLSFNYPDLTITLVSSSGKTPTRTDLQDPYHKLLSGESSGLTPSNE